LDVGETWNVECSGIQNGCYQVLENTNEILETFSGDECTFTEYPNCEECETIIVQPLSAPAEPCNRWDRCDGNPGHIYTPTGNTYPDDTVLYSGVCYGMSGDIPENTEPTDLSLIPDTQFFEKCDFCNPITLNECDTIFITPEGELYSYDLNEDSSILLATGITSTSDVAHIDTKLWVNLETTIDEYNFQIDPFYLIYNRSITVNEGTGSGLSSTNDDNILIGSRNDGGVRYITEIDITTNIATVTNLFSLPDGHSIAGDIALTNSGDFILTTKKFITISLNYFVLQYDSLGNLLFSKNITASNSIIQPYGIFINNNNIFISGNGNEVWYMDNSSPYTLTLSATTTYDINGASQPVSCLTNEIEPNITLTPTPTPTLTPTPSATKPRDTEELWLAINCCDPSDTWNVSVPTSNTKVFVFYDGTSMDSLKAQEASESIRSWYYSNVTGGTLNSGNLYEGIIGANGKNGENWLWWASYPYLGSLSGGTLSDSTLIKEYGANNEAVSNSEYNSGWCKPNNSVRCIPKSTQFNNGAPYDNNSSDIYKRINNGFELTGTYGINDTRSNGVPFDHSLLIDNVESGNGKFDGGINDYIVIIVADEADGAVGLYHSKLYETDLLTDGFLIQGNDPEDFWSSEQEQPSDRYVADYEKFLQVWENNKNNDGRINGLVYPVIDNNTARIPFPLHCVGAIEGETLTPSEFQQTYMDPINDVGNLSLDFSLLETYNPYSSLSSNLYYQNLPIAFQNGPGLKNFGILVDPTVISFDETVVSNVLNNFLSNLDISNYGFNYLGECYYFDSETVGTPDFEVTWEQIIEDYCNTSLCSCASNTPTVTPTPTITPTISLTPTPTIQISDCVSGTTTGNYRFTDCCGVTQIGSSIGKTFCVDTTLFYEGIQPTTLECVVDCDEGPLDVTYSVLPDCNGDGEITLNINGGTKPYTVINTTPGTLPNGQEEIEGNGPFIYSGLSGGTYIFNIYDSTLPTARETVVQIIVPDCLEVTITGTPVSCTSNTGTITLSGNSFSFPYTYNLYYNGDLYDTQDDNINIASFSDNILFGDYYGVIIDGAGQTATTATFTITSNQGSVDFGYSVTGSSRCISTNNGYAEVTGVTGTPPFTYQWTNGQTTASANNLPSGTVSVTVTDSNGCFKTENIEIPQLPNLGIQSYTSLQPQCFSCDGTITITASGGTSPYYFSGSTGQIQSYDSDTFTLTGLCGGAYSISIQDSAQCSLVQNYQLNSTAGFTIVSINTYNSDCGADGSIQINIDGVVGLVTYTLTGSGGNVQTTTISNHTYTFNNLASDTYTVGVESQNGCKYTTEKIISNENKFTVSNSSTGTTCGLNNANVLIEVSSGTTEIIYPLSYTISRISDGFIVFNNVASTSSTQLVNYLTSGTYEITVTDNESCSVNSYVTITEDSKSINAILYGTPCVLGDDGTATLQITSGDAPFTIQWSDNVPESQRNNYEISGLSGDTYTVTITSNDGCQLVKNITIQCNTENVDDYVINTLCEKDFQTTSQGIRGFHEMLNEAFLDLNIPGSNCELVSATFKGVLIVSGGSYGAGQTAQTEFYTGYTLNDYPTNEQWETVVDGLLSQFSGITFTTNITNNIFTIQGICDGDQDPTNGAFVELRAEISLDVRCDGSRVLPSPSVTPSNTSTPSITPTNTPSVTTTPSVTPTISITQTPSVTNTPSNTTTPSVTQTPSNTTTPSITQTPSSTNTPSVTQTPSNTTTPSVTLSPGASPSQTPTTTPSNTQTPSNTATPSVTQTPSNTTTPSVTQTPSNTATPSVTITPSNTQTPSVTITPTLTSTPSVTVTPSSTPPSFNCELVIIGSSRQLTCDLEINYSVRDINCDLEIDSSVRTLNCNLIVSGNYTNCNLNISGNYTI
jgi:hypothetical protein